LLYDGNCRFCCRWVARWKSVTGEQVAYEKIQRAADRFPEIPQSELEAVVHLVEPSGAVRRGAEAVFHTLGVRRGYGWLVRYYARSRIFASVSEWVYRLIARSRRFLP